MDKRLEDLKARSAEVLKEVSPEVREKLIRFARTSRDPKTGKPSPTKAEKRALQSTGDADKALACWQLTVILRDFGEEEFEKQVSDICQTSHQESVFQTKIELKPEEKEMEKEKKERFVVEVMLPIDAEVHVFPVTMGGLRAQLRIAGAFAGTYAAIVCKELLSQLFEADPKDFDWIEQSRIHPEVSYIKDLMIQILEKFGPEPFIEVLEKNGIKVRICRNCKHCKPDWEYAGKGACTLDDSLPARTYTLNFNCKYWAPEEVSGSSEKRRGPRPPSSPYPGDE